MLCMNEHMHICMYVCMYACVLGKYIRTSGSSSCGDSIKSRTRSSGISVY